MFAPTSYLAWAWRFFGKVPFDLATSGTPVASWSEIGAPMPDIDDIGANQRLREAIATYNDVSPDEVVRALGTSHALFLAYAAMTSPGDEILVETPGYEPLSRAAEGLGVTVRTFPRRAEDGFRVDPSLVAARITPRTRAIVVTSLHNPTGVRVSDDTILELARIAEARGAYVLVDEVYAPFDDLPEDGVFRRGARKLAPNVVTVASLTKCYGLGMHRVGWVLGPPEVVTRAEAATLATLGHYPTSHAAFGEAVLSQIGKLATRARQRNGTKRLLAEAWVASHPHLRWSAPEAGLYGLVTIPGAGDLRERIEALAANDGVLVGAGSFFGVPEGFRLSWATSTPERFEEALARLTPLVT